MSLRWSPSPILIKEMRSTMRGSRTFAGITLFLLFLAGITLLVYYTTAQSATGTAAAQAGRAIFGFLSFVELLMLAVVTPPLTAGAIAGERQNKTFDMLMATPLTPLQVLRGKLFASMNYLFLLIFAALPINAIVFLFGGISPTALLWWVALTVVLLLMLGALGLLMSTLFKSSGAATAVAFIVCIIAFVLVPGALVITIMVLSQGSNSGQCVAFAVALLHPVASLLSIIIDETDFNALRLLPASLPLYGAVAALLFLAAEARLASLVAQRRRRLLPTIALLGVAIAAALYIILVPTQAICN